MRKHLILFVLWLSALPMGIYAQSSDVSQIQDAPEESGYCFKREDRSTAILVALRDRGVISRNEYVTGMTARNLGSEAQQVMLDQVQDVYGNPKLDAMTLRVFRTAKCLDDQDRGFVASYNASIGDDLLQCQTKSGGVVENMTPCLIDALDVNTIK